MNKLKVSKRSSAGSDEIYKPHLWYFDNLMFLYDQENPRNTASNIEDDNSHSSEKDVSQEDELTFLMSPLSEELFEENITSPTPTSRFTISSIERYNKKS
ncbi:hypothetical protein CBL_08475 [Carabus blaptoides fortunei]